MNRKSRDLPPIPLVLGARIEARDEEIRAVGEGLPCIELARDGLMSPEASAALWSGAIGGETIESMFEPEGEPMRCSPEGLTTQPKMSTFGLAPKPMGQPLRERRDPLIALDKAAYADVAAADEPSSMEALPVWARFAYPAAIALAALWGGPMIAFSVSYQNRFGAFEYRPFPVIIFSALAILPAIFILLGAYVLRQAAKLSLETRRARAMADELAIPAALAVDQAGGAADAVRREVARATEAGEQAERQLLSLRQALSDESDRLIVATQAAEHSAKALTESLSRERAEMAALSAGLDDQVAAVNQAIGRQTQMVVETSDLAATQLQEAEAVLAARATDLATAAGEAGEAAELAGEALVRQAERLESVGEIVGSRLQALNENLGRGHSRLADLAVQLQADQEALTGRIEAQRISLEAQRLSALTAATEAQATVTAAAEGAESVAASLRNLIAEADDRLRSVAEEVQGEQAALDARARASLSLFRDAVSEERAAIAAEAQDALAGLHEISAATRQATATSAETARIQIEQLGEAAFAAGQHADQAFDARIAAARRAIEQSAALVDEAGDRSVGRIDAGLAAAREALLELESMLVSLDSRIAGVPAEARAQAAMVQAAVESGLADIAGSAKKLMADSAVIDSTLQERVRRNYEMLSEALTTMGKVAAATELAAHASAAPAAPASPALPDQAPEALVPAQGFGMQATPPVSRIVEAGIARPLPASRPAAAAFAEHAIRVPLALGSSTASDPALRPAALATASELGLRPRLRLKPENEIAPAPPAAPEPVDRTPPRTHATLDAFQRPSAARIERPDAPRDTSAWTWKDLLSSIDEPPIDDEVLAERLISEIEALGLDAATLLPLAKIDDIAEAMKRGDVEAVREVVRSLAPGAVRRLSRRVLTDKVLRAQADRYVRRYEDLLNDSARRDHEGFMTAALLGSDPGRAFLLFDAAVGELH